jgi:DNA-binding MarR family transcriptional regulator
VSERAELYEGLEAFLQHLFCLAESDELSFLADVELSFTQVRALFVLAAADEPQPIHQVAHRLGLSLAAVGRSLDGLVRLGSVERRESPADRRVKLVSITPEGLRVVDQHLEPRRRALHTFVEHLSAEHVRAFLTALRPLMAGDHLTAGPSAAHSQLPQTDQKEIHVHHSR